MNSRELIFWCRDLLNGGPVREQLQQIEAAHADSGMLAARDATIRGHLEYATKNVPFYSEYQNAQSLSDFPVINKSLLRTRHSEFLAAGLDQTKTHIASTSGSTGTPLRVYHDRTRRQRIDAEAIYFGREAGYSVGTRLYHLKIWTARNQRSRIAFAIRNIEPVDTSRFNDNDIVDLFQRFREYRRTFSIIAYGSALESIARVLDSTPNLAEGIRGRVASIIAQSEPLSEPARELITRHLGVTPVGRYGLEEVGIVAQQSPQPDGRFWLNQATHVVEVLHPDNDEAVAHGEVGRIVVTDLRNRAQPMIRYDTGDLGAIDPSSAVDGISRALARLDGRSVDRIYDTEDRPLAPMIAYTFWWRYPELRQYQIIQNARGKYILKIDTDTNFSRGVELVNDFRTQVGETAVVNVEHGSDGFRRTSGKYRSVISEYHPR